MSTVMFSSGKVILVAIPASDLPDTSRPSILPSRTLTPDVDGLIIPKEAQTATLEMPPDELQNLAAEFDIDDLAVTPAAPVPVDADILARRVAEAPPELGYLARGLDRRLNPDRILPGVRSVFVGLVRYGGGPERPARLPEGSGWISRFAWCADYHETVGARFKALARALEVRHGAKTRWYVDTGAVLEKAWAARAGLGFIGKNTLLVSPRFGSFVFLGVVLTDIDVSGWEQRTCGAGCKTCDACVRACPVGAIDGSGRLDWSRCLAHLNATSRIPIPDQIVTAGNLFGCDICQDACPHNRGRAEPRAEFAPREGLFCPSLSAVAEACSDPVAPDGFNKMFGGTPVFRRGPDLVGMTAARLLADQDENAARLPADQEGKS
jgi:epoxyqueuosine reductase